MKKVTLITGGSDGLGRALARKLTTTDSVVILGKDELKTKKVAKDIGCEYVIADVADFNSVERAVSEVDGRHERIDQLINVAGIWRAGALDTMKLDEIDRVIDVNLKGVIYCCKAAVPVMKKQKSGYILNVSSTAGLRAKAGESVYVAAKSGVRWFTDSLELELDPFGIRVAGFYPGGMNTQFFVKGDDIIDNEQWMNVDEVAEVIAFMLARPLTMNMDHVVLNKRILK